MYVQFLSMKALDDGKNDLVVFMILYYNYNEHELGEIKFFRQEQMNIEVLRQLPTVFHRIFGH